MYKDELLKNTKNTKLSYIGAAILGIVLSNCLLLVMSGQLFNALIIYIMYFIIIMYVSVRCDNNCRVSCEVNEFWLVLEVLISRMKINQ